MSDCFPAGVREACEADDPTLMQEAMASFSQVERQRENEMRLALISCAEHNAIEAAQVLLDAGADASSVPTRNLVRHWHLPSSPRVDSNALKKEFIDLLINYGRPFNSSKTNTCPFLRHVLTDEESIEWCLERGAQVSVDGLLPDRPGITGLPSQFRLLPELIKQEGSVRSFKRLANSGAPIRRDCLELAIMTAANPKHSVDWANDRMEIVRFIVDKRGLNVVPPDTPDPNYHPYDPCRDSRSNLFWFCRHARDHTLQVVRFLIERGALPTEKVISTAKEVKFDASQFLELVDPLPRVEPFKQPPLLETLPVGSGLD